MINAILNLTRKRRFLFWLFIRYIAFFTFTYMAYYLVAFILYETHHINWKTFNSYVFVLMPYTIFLGVGVIVISIAIEKYITRLTNNIERVANGDFKIKMNVKKSGPFKKVYSDFNTMVRELNQVQALRNDFINQFSHEFKTPITSIKGFAKILKDKSLSPEQRILYLDTIEKEATRLAKLSTNVMTLTALEGQEIVTNKEWYSLTEQLRQATILAFPIAKQKHITIELELEEINYFSDPTLLAHAWNNLIGNALKFTPKNGHVWIKAWNEGDNIKVSFTNDGPFIPREQQALLFDKFYQEDTGVQKEGLGLGLAIVKRILELTNSTITVTSDKIDKTSFTISLPTSDLPIQD